MRTRQGAPATIRASLLSTTLGARRPSRCVARYLNRESSDGFGHSVASIVFPIVSSSTVNFCPLIVVSPILCLAAGHQFHDQLTELRHRLVHVLLVQDHVIREAHLLQRVCLLYTSP